MKKWTAILLTLAMVLSLTACAQGSSADLMAGVAAKAVDVLPEMEAGAAAAADFGVELFQTALAEGENTLISPLSVLCALAMTANGADGQTQAQMEQVLGQDTDTLNGFMLAYMDALGDELHLANAIWLKEDPALTVQQSFLQTNADYYGAGAYKAPFDDGTRKEINDWVKDHTDGMIPAIVEEIPPEAVLYLVNALAFEAQWTEVYRESQVRQRDFRTEDGRVQEAELMYCEEHAYLEDDLATGFIKYYQGGRYAFAALLPNEGVTVSEYVQSLSGQHLRQLLSAPQSVTVDTGLPKFETGSAMELSLALEEMGITDAFRADNADFSRMGSYGPEGWNLYISRVLHRTYIQVGEQGTKAGAATAVEMNPGSAAPDSQPKSVILDRPFVYMVIDCETNLPIFLGTLMEVG